jgi:hypothetical protein
LKFTRYVIPQVPGSVKRSRPVRGVLESLLRAKKYIVVLAAFHPLIGGAAVSADLIGDRFSPARNSLVFNSNGEPQAPPTNEERHTYVADLRDATTHDTETGAPSNEINWRKFIEKAQPELDADGQAVLQAVDGRDTVELGVTRGDLQTVDAPMELQRELMVSRLKQSLANSRAPRISGNELREDWRLLEKIQDAEQLALSKELDHETQLVNQ